MDERLLRTVIEQSPLSTHVFSPDGSSLLTNAAWKELWNLGEGEAPEETNVFEDHQLRAVGLIPYIEESIASNNGLSTPPLLYVTASGGLEGKPRWLRGFIYPVRDENGRFRAVSLMLEDVTKHRVLEERLTRQALEDPLTGLANRTLLMDRLEHALSRIERREHKIALLFMDLDDFKRVNDSLGHSAGDRMLVEVADRIGVCLRPEDTLARFGGDEFVVLLENAEDASAATQVAERIARGLRAPIAVDGHEVFATFSIGIALGNSGKVDAEYLLRGADAAMYRGKREGENRCEVFNLGENGYALDRLRLESDLRRAVEGKEFRVHYQPKVELRTGKIVGLEALLRWEHPEHGLTSPLEFVPLAEQTGLIIPIGWWVLREACHELRLLQEQHPVGMPLTMSVNLSARQFRYPELVEEVAEILGETALAPHDLTLEVTETVAMEHAPSTTTILGRLKSLGVKLAIDDFGTGYSSLSYLKRFPVDALKVDQSLVKGIEQDSGNAAIVSATITLAHDLGLEVVAEGVETAGEFAKVRSLQSNHGQGHYWWGASPAVKIAELFAPV